jgi:DNA-binding CsgD family transcriptional regulator
MDPFPSESGNENQDALFERPAGILLDEKQWLYLQKRYHMTPRELQVAILVCRGFNNDEIAKALKIRRGTIKTHLRNIYRRVRVKSKVTLLLRFVEDVKKYYTPAKTAGPTPPIPIIEKLPKSPRIAQKTPEKTKP